MIENQEVSVRIYEELSRLSHKLFDNHYWVEDEKLSDIAGLLRDISSTAELVIDEFEKVESIRQQSNETMANAEQTQQSIIAAIQPDSWELVEQYVEALDQLRHQRGHLTTIREYRYIDTARIDKLEQVLIEQQDALSNKTVEFLASEGALRPYLKKIDDLNRQVEKADTIAALTPPIETIESTASALDLLSELMAMLKVDDATVRTRIIEDVSSVYSKLNQSKAQARHKQRSLGSEEARAQFGAQFKLFSQSITNALGMSTTPERCDEQLSRLLVQLEELESQFSDYDQFLGDIMAKREELYESFENHKQQLLDERQRKAQSVADAASRILNNIERRSLKFTEADELNTYFASDALVQKTKELIDRLRELDNAVKADDIASRFKSIQEQALRALRDKREIYESDGKVIRLGPRHKFSVNTQDLDLTLIPRERALYVHLTGTDYFDEIENSRLTELKDYWDITLESESPQVYRAEYLAYDIINAAIQQKDNQNREQLLALLNDDQALTELIKAYAAPRYKEGYEKGVHDHDAALIIRQVLPAMERADLLRYDPLCRGLAQIFWANLQKTPGNNSKFKFSHENWVERAQSAYHMQRELAQSRAIDLLVAEVTDSLALFLEMHPIPVTELDRQRAAEYLVAELEKINLSFEMGNNVMLYLDDIQHTHPEFLQKYISLCDGTRRIDGVWKGRPKTYDMRGRKFCVVMAGNPYTESGEVFKVPDMLANRADIYNLGDILGGLEEQFASSYIENCLTSNRVLAPLATRDMQDVYKLMQMARGKEIPTTELTHQYSGAEINEIVEVLKKLYQVQGIVLKINQQYIASAAQEDKYRTEPPFKLQGSYRNMNKMAEKVSAVMNDEEMMRLIRSEKGDAFKI